MRIKFNVDRYMFLALQAEGKILDCGCQDASGWAHGSKMLKRPYDYLNHVPDITYFDMDKWSHPNFVRGDAHHLPFKDNSFDTVVSGDVLEHVVNPITFVTELIRTARSKVIITTPDEYQWHKDLYPLIKSKDNPANIGLTEDEMAKKDTLYTKSLLAKCTDYVKESKAHHLYHIRQFTPFSFIDLIHLVFRGLNPDDISKSNPIKSFEINHFYHPLAPRTPEEPQDMAYWSCVFYKE